MKNNAIKVFQLSSILLIFSIVINIVLINLPLFNLLSYEYSALNAIILFICFGFIFINSYNKKYSEQISFLEILIENFVQIFLLILLPIIISLYSTIFIQKCPIGNGLSFYLLITVPAAFFGSALSYYLVSINRKFAYLIFIFVFILISFSSLLEIYYNSQVYFFNPIILYFPGVIYDETIDISTKMVSYRILNILFFSMLIPLANYNKNFRKKIISIFSVFIIVAVFGQIKFIAGYSTSLNKLRDSLGGEIITENFDIIYPANTDSSIISNIALQHEYYYSKISLLLGARKEKKITSVLFESAEQKKKLFGAKKADVAKPWLFQIYLDIDDFSGSLKHELAHIFSAKYGVTPFKLAAGFNPALIEGFACAVEDDYSDYPIHYMAALANMNNMKASIEKLFSGFNFFTQTSSLSYVYSGSFIKFLIQRYGISPVEKVYNDGDFDQQFGKSLTKLAEEYFNFLDKIKIENIPDRALLYFGRKPIFKKLCLRYVASKTKYAGELYRKKKYIESFNEFKSILNTAGTYSSLVGYTYAGIKLNNLDSVKFELNKRMPDFKNTSYYYNIELVYADILSRTFKVDSAAIYYQRIIDQFPNGSYYSAAASRLLLLKQGATKIENYLSSEENQKFNFISKLNEDSLNIETIPVLLRLFNLSGRKYSQWISKFVKFKVNDFISSYSCFLLSKFSMKYADYMRARFFALKSLKYKHNNFYSQILKENLKMIHWILEYGDEAKQHFNFVKKYD